MQLECKLVKKFEYKQVAKKDGTLIFKKNEEPMMKGGCVVKLKGKYPKDLFVEIYNPEMADFISNTSVDTELILEINMESREWKENWFTTVSAWKGDVVKSDDAPAAQEEDDTNDLPF